MGAPIVPKTIMTLTTMSPGRRVSGQPWKPSYHGKEVVSSPGQEASKQREDTCDMFRGSVYWRAVDRPLMSLQLGECHCKWAEQLRVLPLILWSQGYEEAARA